MRIQFIALLFLALWLVGCGGREITPAPVAATLTPESAPTPTATLSTPLAILVMPADTPAAQYEQYQTLVYGLAQASGMRFQVLNTLTLADLQLAGAALRVVIVFPPDPGLAELAAAAPAAQFLAVGMDDVTAGANISTISVEAPVDRQAFVAGYTAAMLSADYRVGILYIKDDPVAAMVVPAFTAGYQFYCGLCRQQFPPWYVYPALQDIAADVPLVQYPAYAEVLPVRSQADVVYLYAPVATPEVLDRLAAYNVLVIGETLAYPDFSANWVMSIEPRPIEAIQAAFPELAAGRGGQAFPTSLFLADVNPALLSEGKQRLVQQLLDDLQAGLIATGVNP